MPTYEYRCNACGREFEYQQRMSDDDLVTCEVCKEPKLEKLISRTAFQLKGSGWYKDLYSSAPAAGTKDAGDKSTAAAPAAKTETAAAPAAATPASSGSSSGGSSSGGSSGAASGGTSGGTSSGGGSTATSAAKAP